MAAFKNKSLLLAALLLFLLLDFGQAQKLEASATARTCSSASVRFKGLCFNSANCQTICRSERFRSGGCSPWRRRCMCTKPC